MSSVFKLHPLDARLCPTATKRGNGAPAHDRSDPQPVRGRDRRGDIGLGGAHRLAQIEALGEPGGDRRRQRAAGAVRVFGGDARGREPRERRRLDQEVDALGAARRARP